MARFLYSNPDRSFRKYDQSILALFWTAGLILGTWCSASAGDLPLPMMRRAVFGTVSIVSLLCSVSLPLLLSAFAVYFSAPRLFFPIAFVKAFLFAWVSACCTAAFDSSGWLIRLLFLFSDSLSLGLLYFFWVYHLDGNRKLSFRTAAVLIAAVALIAGVDFCVIAPFLRGLFL